MGFTGSLEDRLQLRELLDRYADAVLRQDADDWGACWAEEAVWNLTGSPVRGRAAIVALWRQAMGEFAITGFAQIPGSLRVDGDSAMGDCQTIERLVRHDGHVRAIWGASSDRFVREGGEWRIADRRYRIVHEMAQG